MSAVFVSFLNEFLICSQVRGSSSRANQKKSFKLTLRDGNNAKKRVRSRDRGRKKDGDGCKRPLGLTRVNEPIDTHMHDAALGAVVASVCCIHRKQALPGVVLGELMVLPLEALQ